MTYFQVGMEEGNRVHNRGYFVSKNVMAAGPIHSLV